MNEAQQAYGTVLADLRARLKHHQAQVESLTVAIQVLSLAAPGSSNGAAPIVEENEPTIGPVGRYVGMGYRKAILLYMADSPDRAYDTGTVSDALQAGGMTTKGVSFSSNVSATLSDMAKKYGEIEKTQDGLWKLTGAGYAHALGLIHPSDSPANDSAQQSLQ
jgi:hypothetical protein